MPADQQKSAPIDLDFTLRRVFGKAAFRPFQREIITTALEGHDVFVQAATSFGKSLCYQLPAIIDHGITIVVSPLLALMHNQVSALRAANIQVETLNSKTPYSDKQHILDDLKCGHPLTRLLYITPEYTLTETFRKHLSTIYSQGEFSRIAIDEAHCISEWGHDFRPAYCQLSYFRATYPSVPIICLTATATPSVRKDVIKTLGLDPATLRTYCTSTSRPNLHYEVRFISDNDNTRFESLLDWLRAIYSRRTADPTRSQELAALHQRPNAVSGIIYTSLRSDTESLATRLRAKGIGASPYHAGLPKQDRDDCQQKWLDGAEGYDIIVATTAFGMGIDKQDVRFVIHWTLPKSFEGYYQEAGRAGRDGKAGACILFYSREDRDRVAYRLSRDVAERGAAAGAYGEEGGARLSTQAKGRATSFQELVKYCEGTKSCRHRFIHTFFDDGAAGLTNHAHGMNEDAKGDHAGEGSSWAGCDFACDHCKDADDLKRRKNDGLASEEWVSTQREREGDGWYGECD